MPRSSAPTALFSAAWANRPRRLNRRRRSGHLRRRVADRRIELPRLDVSKAAMSSGSTQRTLAVGRGARTNDEGIRQLRALLDGSFDELIVVPLPDWPGQHDVMHLMSLISPVDSDLAVVYSRLLPEPFRERLLRSGVSVRRGAGRGVRDDGHERAGARAARMRDAERQSENARRARARARECMCTRGRRSA